MSRSIKDYIFISLKGIAMGAADVIPGVSGGTIAFISGIYEELITSIKSLNIKNLKKLFKEGFKSFWSAINGFFLLSLVIGIGVSILSLAKLFHYLLDEFPIFIWSFFFGLIVASAIYVAMQIRGWNYKIVLAILVGTGIAFFVTTITPVAESGSPSHIYILLCGMVAICAMILPGISGSFILLLMGQFRFILSALSEMKGDYIAVFGVGAVIGIISFSNVLSWLLKKFHDITVAFLAGFMIGSLNKVWPWKHTLESYVNSNAKIIPISRENVLPNTFYELTAKDPQTFYAILMAITGFLVIFLLQSTFSRIKGEEKE
jgi:putative membrane protein